MTKMDRRIRRQETRRDSCVLGRVMWNANAGADLTGCSFLRMKRVEFLPSSSRRRLAKQTHLFSFYTHPNVY